MDARVETARPSDKVVAAHGGEPLLVPNTIPHWLIWHSIFVTVRF
mgnify:CR=1